MKLARKLVLAFIGAIFTLLTIYGYHRVNRESALFETDMLRDAHTMGRALGAAVSDVWRADGEARAIALVEGANDRGSDLRIRWVWVDAPEKDSHRARLGPDELEPVLHGREVVKMDTHGMGTMLTYVPVDVPDGRRGALEIAESLASRDAYVRGTVVSTVLTTSALSIVCGLIALWVGIAFVGRPIHALIRQARRIGVGDFSQRLDLEQRDEVGELAGEMNSMCDRLEEANRRIAAEAAAKTSMQEQLRHAERLTTVGKLASGIAHELGTPLNVVSVRARMIAVGEAKEAAIVDNARIIVEQTERMTKIIRQLLDFARRRGAQKAWRDLTPIATQTIALLEPLAQKKGVKLYLDKLGDDAEIECDEGQIQQALTNLVINAIHAMPTGGRVDVKIASEHRREASADRPGGEFVRVSVIDQGQGIASDVRPFIFEPFFTTKDIGEGTGLGLSVTYGIMQEHGGFIDVESEAGKGSKFSLYFPRRSEVS
jgi:signal transduction histidine kinase